MDSSDEIHFRAGTTNLAKLEALREILADYPHLKSSLVEGVKTDSGVADQPRTLEDTVRGAINRAKSAKDQVDYGVGIESGMMAVPFTKSGYMDVCAAAIYDGSDVHVGLSSAWEFPDPTVTKLIMERDMNMSEAIYHAGLTQNQDIGQAEGAVGILTKGRVDRKEYSKQALRMALIHIDQV